MPLASLLVDVTAFVCQTSVGQARIAVLAHTLVLLPRHLPAKAGRWSRRHYL